MDRYEGLWRSPLKPTTSALGVGRHCLRITSSKLDLDATVSASPRRTSGRRRAPGAPPRHHRQHHGADRRPIADGIKSSRHHHVERASVTTARHAARRRRPEGQRRRARHHHHDGDRRQAGVRGRREPYSAPGRQGYPGQPEQAHTVKLGPIGARRVPAGLLFVQQKSKKGFIFRCFRRYQQAEKAARLQVVWSWHPLLMSSLAEMRRPNRAWTNRNPRGDGDKKEFVAGEHEGNR
jgi:hypothetical protein